VARPDAGNRRPLGLAVSPTLPWHRMRGERGSLQRRGDQLARSCARRLGQRPAL